MLGYVLYKVKLKNLIVLLIILISCYHLKQKIFVNESHENVPVLLWWTPMILEDSQLINCDKSTCLLTRNREYQTEHNLAFLFYGSDFNISDLPVQKNKRKWAIFHEESPRNQAVFLSNKTWELFDITATFSRYSHFPLTLHYLKNLDVLLDKTYFIDVENKNTLLNQIAPVLYIQSDCDTPNDRDGYVAELMKFIKIDSYGACLNNRKFPDSISGLDPLDVFNEKFLKFIAQYKFIIAIENAICDDYITEKLWRPLIVGSIPIYLGSPTVEDWLPNQKSAILVKDFKSPELLANYINELNENNQLYNEFLIHKIFNRITNVRLIDMLANQPFNMLLSDDNHPIPAFQCYVCQYLYNNIKINRIKNSVYNCQLPRKGNQWEYYWELGHCQGELLVEFIKNGNRSDVGESCKQLR